MTPVSSGSVSHEQLGWADDYRQEYFSLRVFLRNSSSAGLASLDRKWEAEAEEVKRQNKTL